MREAETAPLIALAAVTKEIGDGVMTTLVRDIDLD